MHMLFVLSTYICLYMLYAVSTSKGKCLGLFMSVLLRFTTVCEIRVSNLGSLKKNSHEITPGNLYTVKCYFNGK